MSSNFVKLYALYARSHFLIAGELMFYMLIYYHFTSHLHPLPMIKTWPAWLVIVAITIAPWFFNPRAFQGLTVYQNLQVRDGHLPPSRAFLDLL